MRRTLHPWLVVILMLSPLWVAGALLADDVPEVVRDLLEQASRQQEAERFEEAISTYREALRLGPEVLNTHLRLGALLHSSGRSQEALETFEQGLEVAPQDRQLLFNAAVLALRLERFDDALLHVQKALQNDRKDSDLLSLEGAVLQGLGRPQDALASLLLAVKKKPNDPQLLLRLGNLHAELGSNEAAAGAFRKAIKNDSKLLRAYYNLGAVLYQMQRFEEAMDAYEVALQPINAAFAAGQPVDSVHALAYSNLGAIHLKRDAWNAAVDAYSKSLRLLPESSDALYSLGFAYYQLRQFDSASAAYEKALTGNSDLPMALLHLGFIHQRRGEHGEAVASFHQALPKLNADTGELRNELEPALWAMVQSQRTLGSLEAAETTLRQLLQLRPDHLSARLELARLMRDSDRISEARTLLSQAEAQRGDDLNVLLELAALARLDADRTAERGYYGKILAAGAQQEHRLWPARLRLVLMLLEEGETANTLPHLRKLDQLASSGRAEPPIDATQRALIQTLEGIVQLAAGDQALAHKSLTAAAQGGSQSAANALRLLRASDGDAAAVADDLAQHADPTTPVLAANLAQVLWLAGRGDAARPLLRRALESFDGWPSLHAAMGDLELQADRHVQAKQHLTRAQNLCQSSDQPSVPAAGAGSFTLLLGGDGAKLCAWIGKALASARLGAGLDQLAQALGSTSASRALRDDMSAVLATRPSAADQASALFVRGSARLALGNTSGARQDLEAALGGSLGASLRPYALNNLAVAWVNEEQPEKATTALRSASSASGAPSATRLHLGIVLDQHLGQPEAALAHYDAYLADSNAERRREVESWVASLRRIYP